MRSKLNGVKRQGATKSDNRLLPGANGASECKMNIVTSAVRSRPSHFKENKPLVGVPNASAGLHDVRGLPPTFIPRFKKSLPRPMDILLPGMFYAGRGQ